MELCFIASCDDLCLWCNVNKPSSIEYNIQLLKEWTINQGKLWMSQMVRHITFNPLCYIAGYPEYKDMYIENGIFNEELCSLNWIYSGSQIGLNMNKLQYHPKVAKHVIDSKKKLTFTSYGNCQADAIAKMLLDNKTFSDMYDYIKITEVHRLNNTDLDKIYNVDLFIFIPCGESWGEKSTSSIISKLKLSCITIGYSGCFFRAYHPQITYIHLENSGKHLESPSPYHDINSISEHLNNTKILYTENLINSIVTKDITELNLRKKQIIADHVIPIDELIKDNYKKKLLMHTINHPTIELFSLIRCNIMEFLHLPHNDYRNVDYMEHHKCKIYKSVAKVLNTHEVPTTIQSKTLDCQSFKEMSKFEYSKSNIEQLQNVRKIYINNLNIKTHYISIGEFCLTSCVLKDLKLKEFSLPFDWIFSNPYMLYNCISDGFSTFLDRTQYKTIQHQKCNHKQYGDIFNHHDPCKNDKDYQYFQRCVGRFQNIFMNVFEHVTAFLTHSVGTDFENEIKTYHIIKSILPEHFNLVLICLKYDSEIISESSIYHSEHNFHIYVMKHKSSCTGVDFSEQTDNEIYQAIISSHIRPIVI